MPALWILWLGCAARQPIVTPPPPPPPPLIEPSPEVAYADANAEARYPRPSRVSDSLIALVDGTPGLEWDGEGRVLMRTWTRAQYFQDPEYVPGYTFPLYGETWLTTGTEVADVCSDPQVPREEVDLRLQQLLGLPPGSSYDSFMEVWVEPDALFRPCADPDVTTTTCPVAEPLVAGDGDEVWLSCGDPDADAHTSWLCASWVNRYSPSDPQRQYPWTALGYTYDWGVPEDPVGATEFVAPAKTPVVFHSLQATVDFCAPVE